MTILGALRFVPPAIVAEKVSESTLLWIERMLQEGQVPKRRILGRLMVLVLPQLLQHNCEKECASIVVGGVSLCVVRDGEDCVLQHSGVIGQPVKVLQVQSRQLIQCFLCNAGGEPHLWSLHAVATNVYKTFHVTLRHSFPDHLAREQVSTLTHGVAYCRGIQKIHCLSRDSIGILEGNQRATAVVQQLDRMPIWGRDDCLART